MTLFTAGASCWASLINDRWELDRKMTWCTVGAIASNGVATLPFEDQNSTGTDIFNPKDLCPTNKEGKVTLGHPLLKRGYLKVILCMGNLLGLSRVILR